MNTKKYFTIVPILSALIIMIIWFSFYAAPATNLITDTDSDLRFGYPATWAVDISGNPYEIALVNTRDMRAHIGIKSIKRYQLGVAEGHLVYLRARYAGFRLDDQWPETINGYPAHKFLFHFTKDGITYSALEALIETGEQIKLVGFYIPADSFECPECELENLYYSVIL
jgi:hypothetical protein